MLIEGIEGIEGLPPHAVTLGIAGVEGTLHSKGPVASPRAPFRPMEPAGLGVKSSFHAHDLLDFISNLSSSFSMASN